LPLHEPPPMSMTERLRRLGESTRRFVSAYRWMAGTHLRPNWKRVASIGIFSAVSAGAQGGVIGFIAFALDAIQHPDRYGLADLVDDHQILVLCTFGAALGCIAAIGAFANYAATRTARSLGRSLHERCADETIKSLAALHTLPDSMPFDEPQLIRLVSRNGMLLGRTTQALVGVIEPLLRLVVAMGILVYIDVRLAVVMIPLVVLMLPGLLRVGSNVKSTSESYYDKSAPEMGRHARSIVSSINNQDMYEGDHRVERYEGLFLDDRRVQTYLDEYDTINLANARVRLFMNSASSTVLGFALIGSAYLAITNVMTWPMVMLFLMALWQLQRALVQCGSLFAILNLFYPFVAQSRSIMSPPGTDSAPGLEIPLILHSLGDCASVTLRVGDRVALVTDTPLDRIHIASLLEPVAEQCGVETEELVCSLAFVTDRYKVQDQRIGEALECAPDDPLLDRLGIRGLVDELEDGLDTRLDTEGWNQLPAELKTALCLVPASRSTRPVLALDARLLKRLSTSARSVYDTMFTDRLMLLHSQGPAHADGMAELYLVVTDHRLVGWGNQDWFDDLKATLADGEVGEPEADDEDESLLLG